MAANRARCREVELDRLTEHLQMTYTGDDGVIWNRRWREAWAESGVPGVAQPLTLGREAKTALLLDLGLDVPLVDALGRAIRVELEARPAA